MARQNKCLICKAKIKEVDYKDVNTISRYLDRWQKIQPSYRNNNCARHQRQLSTAIKRARFLALLPFVGR
ncbi:MAG TPA: 30S ribosomal protein S18 [bacterium]|nr:30S ribosomal protein S18 [bacterium]